MLTPCKIQTTPTPISSTATIRIKDRIRYLSGSWSIIAEKAEVRITNDMRPVLSHVFLSKSSIALNFFNTEKPKMNSDGPENYV